MSNPTFASTYFTTAPDYFSRGWIPLPIPRGEKSPPPPGTTGHDARPITAADVASWSSSSPNANVALRLPPTVVGIDVDAYHGGLETLSAAESSLGSLPPTWSSSSRSDGSGIRFFRVPSGRRFAGLLGQGVDIVQGTHRYALAWPSVHPSGATYLWTPPDGEPSEGVLPPGPDDLPLLPPTWLERLTRSSRPDVDLATWEATLDGGEPSEDLRAALETFRSSLTTGGSRHSAALAFTKDVASLSCDPGASTALAAGRAAYRDAHSDPATADHDFQRALHGAVQMFDPRRLLWTPSPAAAAAWRRLFPLPSPPSSSSSPSEGIFANVVPINSMSTDLPPELVHGWLHEGTSGVLVGPSGGGKSFIALDLAFSIARGIPWCGLDTTPGRILYVAGEGTFDLRQRYSAWLESRGLEDVLDPGVDVWPADHVLTDPEVQAAFHTFVASRGYALVILDTLAKLTSGLDENTRLGMDAVHDVARGLHRVAPQTSILWIHHVNKSGVFSGHQSLYNGADFFWSLTGPHTALELHRNKNKYGPDGDFLPLELVPSGRSLAAVQRHDLPAIPDAVTRRRAALVAIAHDYGHRGTSPEYLPGFTKANAVQALRAHLHLSQSTAYVRFSELEQAGDIVPSDTTKRDPLWTLKDQSVYRFIAPHEARALGLDFTAEDSSTAS